MDVIFFWQPLPCSLHSLDKRECDRSGIFTGLHHTILQGERVHGPFAMSPNELWLAGQGEAAAGYVWAVSGGPPRVLTGHSLGVYSLSFSPDSTFLATASDDRTGRVWDLKSLDSYELELTNPVADIVFAADGAALVVGSGGSLHRWFVPSGSAARLCVTPPKSSSTNANSCRQTMAAEGPWLRAILRGTTACFSNNPHRNVWS